MNPATVADAINILSTLLTTVTNAVANANQVSSIVVGAQQQGRTTLTDDEWALVNKANADSRQSLVDSINKAFADAGLSTRVQ